MIDPTVTTLLGCAALAVAACGAAALLRAARCPGATVLGGLAVGMLLGASVAGRVWPGPYEAVWTGGAEPREARGTLLRRHGAELEGARHVGMGEQAFAEMQRRHAQERQVAEDAVRAAEWSHQRPLRGFVLILAAVVLAAGAGAGGRAAPGERPAAATALSVGVWAAAVPGVTVFVVLDRVLGYGLAPSLLAAAAVGIGPLALTAIDRRAADDAELGGAALVRGAGRLMTLLAAAAAIVALVVTRSWHAGPAAAALVAFVPGWLAPGAWAEGMERVSRGVLVPSLAAAAMLPLDLLADAAVWPIVVVLIVSGDGRWIGATLGAIVPGGRRWLRTMRLVIGIMACGPSQLALTAVALHLKLVPTEIALALVLGALLLDAAPPLRRWMANQLTEMEQQLGDEA